MTHHHTKKRSRAETATLLAATLACYLAAAACVFAIGYTLTTLAARDAGRRVEAAVVTAPHGF